MVQFIHVFIFGSIFSTAESVHLCYTNHCVGCVVVNNLIRAHYNIIMKTTVASDGKLPVPYLVTRCPLAVMVWCGHCDELSPLGVTVLVVIIMN